VSESNQRLFWIASYPRSGNTWVRMYLYNLAEILHGARIRQNINLLHCFSPSDANRIFYGKYLKWSQQKSIADVMRVRHSVQQELAREPNEFADECGGKTLVKTNWLLGRFFDHSSIDLPLEAGAVYLIRNPLDVAVSLAHHMNKPVDTAIDFMSMSNASVWGDSAAVLTGSWSQHVVSWTQPQHKNVCVIRYEDLLHDAEIWFTTITRQIFVNRAVAAEPIRQAIEWSSFEVLRAQEEMYGFVGAATGTERFFRAGQSGLWKGVLTTQQVDRIVKSQGEQMNLFGYLPVG
jgi:Sulfotransferase domain